MYVFHTNQIWDSIKVQSNGSLHIDRLQPRDKAAMLVVKTIKNFFAEFA